jgi:hypothetical protein
MLTAAQSNTFEIVKRILPGGRALFFESADTLLPKTDDENVKLDDRTPQFGFVGDAYETGGVLIVGINPGIGPRSQQLDSDRIMMEALRSLQGNPSALTYKQAMAAQMKALPEWPAGPIIKQELKTAERELNEIAYINSNPYRAGNGDARDLYPLSATGLKRQQQAADNWVRPMLTALRPGLIVALDYPAAEVLQLSTDAQFLRLGDAESRLFIINRRGAKLRYAGKLAKALRSTDAAGSS